MLSMAAIRRAVPLRPASVIRGFQTSAARFQAPKVKVSVDGREVEVAPGSTVLQACEVAGVDVPRFCYHERLSIAGNCRMCLVEVEKSPKPVASCAMPIMPGMKIKTATPMVFKAREGVMEFLLANHPLDCPICDQGGECDLQDQSLAYGSDRSRFKEFKRTVEDKNIGPFIKTIMTRCIHCTRCVRFAAEVAGVEDLGATGRGNQMEIGTYVSKYFDSEMSGNVIDICPVGALTSKPFAFTARPWELEYTESIDVMDAAGSNIRVDSRGVEVMRVLPRLNESINEEWLADKSRYAYDGLKRQRLDTPMVKVNGQLRMADWLESFEAVKGALKGLKTHQIKGIVGDQMDAEAMVAFKDLLNRLGSSNIESRQDGANFDSDVRANYLFNTQIANLELADTLLLVNCNPRMEAAIINARIRKATVHSGLSVYSVGPKLTLNYPHQPLGNDPATLAKIADGSHPFSQVLKESQRPVIIVGTAALRRPDSAAVLSTLSTLAKQYPALRNEEWNGISFLQLAAARTGALELGLVPGATANDKAVKFVYLLGADEYAEAAIPSDAFVVYQGHHGDRGAARANVILPGAAYTEKEGTYVNTEGRVQRTRTAVPPVGEARNDWAILTALAEFLGVPLPYSSLSEVRARLADVSPTFARVDSIEPSTFFTPLELFQALNIGNLGTAPFQPALNNYFMTDPISRTSKNMAKATQQLKTSSNSFA